MKFWHSIILDFRNHGHVYRNRYFLVLRLLRHMYPVFRLLLFIYLVFRLLLFIYLVFRLLLFIYLVFRLLGYDIHSGNRVWWRHFRHPVGQVLVVQISQPATEESFQLSPDFFVKPFAVLPSLELGFAPGVASHAVEWDI